MASKTIKKPAQATGGKQARKAHAAPRAAGAASSPGSPSSPGQSLPAVIPPDLSSPAVVAEIALQERQRKQKWTSLPKTSKIRALIAKATAMRIDGMSTEEIATALNVKPATIRQYRWIAAKKGWLTTSDPHDYAENILVHRAVSNLEELLHARNAVNGLPDKEVTLETVKGLGIFKDHSKPEQAVNAQANMLTINVVLPQGTALPQVRPGNAGGSPAYVDGSVVDA